MIPFHVLGRTGVRVSRFGLGTMVLGAWGNTDHDACVRIIHKALDAGINLVDTADVYAFGESEEIVGTALRDGRREHTFLATKFHNGMGDATQPAGQLATVDRPSRRGQPAAARHRLDRPVPDPPTRPDRGDRRDGGRPH